MTAHLKAKTQADDQPIDEPISVGHAAYFSPYAMHDPLVNRVTGMVAITEVVDAGGGGLEPLFRIRNVDNQYVCCAFADELQEPW